MATPFAPSTLNAVVEPVLAVEDHAVAVGPADHEVVGGDRDRLVVHAGRDEDQVAGRGGVDRRLDRLLVLGHPDRARLARRRAAWARPAVTAAGTVPSALRTITVPYIPWCVAPWNEHEYP